METPAGESVLAKSMAAGVCAGWMDFAAEACDVSDCAIAADSRISSRNISEIVFLKSVSLPFRSCCF